MFQLPAQMHHIIGREDDIHHARSLLTETGVRLLTLTGPGGVGKTRLALEIAREVQSSFPAGCVFVSLASLPDPTQVLPAIALALALEEIPHQPLLARLQLFLRDKKMLLILDNFEHVLDAGPALADLLALAPTIQVLITSREMLHLYGEYEYVVSPLSLPEVQAGQSLATLHTSASLRLFVERARAVQPAFTLSTANMHVIAQICIQLDGLPLAIELAAAHSKLLPPAQILARLQNRLQTLVGGARNLPARQQTLRNTLDWSYNLLTPEERVFFARLGIFTASYDLRAIHAVCLPEQNDEATLRLVSSLVDKSLLRPLPTTSTPRFQTLEIIREYALERLTGQNDRISTGQAHARHYLSIAQEAAPHIHGPEQQLWLQRLDTEREHFDAALRWSLAHQETMLALALGSSLLHYLILRHGAREEHNWFSEILSLPGTTRFPHDLAIVLYGAGRLAYEHNCLPTAHSRLEECIHLASQHGLIKIQALALGALAQCHLHQGHTEKARQLAYEGLALLEGRHDLWSRGILHSICGLIVTSQSDFVKAQVHYKLGLRLLRQAGDARSQATILNSVGHTMRQRGKLVTAQFLYEQALDFSQKLTDQWGQIMALTGLGEVLNLRGDYTDAHTHLTRCFTLTLAQGSGTERVTALLGLGTNALYQGQLDEATQYYRDGLHHARELSYTPGITRALLGLGDIAFLHSHYSDATHFYRDSLSQTRDTGDRALMCTLLTAQGHISLVTGDYAGAVLHFKQAIHTAQEINTTLELSAALAGFARLCGSLSMPERAVQFLATAEALRESGEASRPLVYQSHYQQEITSYKERIGESAFYENWSVGQNMSLKHTLGMLANVRITFPTQTSIDSPTFSSEHKLETATPTTLSKGQATTSHTNSSADTKEQHTSPTLLSSLTARETEVLRLLATGVTDAHIARELVLSPRTVNTHLRSIYAKLGVSTRSAATRLALEQKLVE